MHLKRLLVANVAGAILLGVRAAPALAQTNNVDPWNGSPYVTGNANTLTFTTSNTTMAINATWILGNNYFISLNMSQTKAYLGGAYSTLTPAVIVNSASGGPGNGTGQSSMDFLSWFLNYVASASTSSSTGYRAFGEWNLVVKVTSGSGGSGTVLWTKTYTWDYTPLDAQSGVAQQLANGSAATVSAINSQAVNQQSFWSGLFVPNQSDIDNCKTAINQFMSWGPFGLFTIIKNEFPSTLGSLAIDPTPYQISLPIPYTHGITMDLTPYQGYVKMARAIVTGAMWWIVLFVMWKRMYQKV